MRKERIRELAENINVLGHFDAKEYTNPQGPVVSLYVPIKRTEREERRDEWDKVEFKDLLNEAKRTLSETYSEEQVGGILTKLDYILSNEDLPLWIDASAGLALLVNNEEASVFNMSIAPEPTVVVGTEYYIKPLLRDAQFFYHYKLLLLNSDFFALLNGDYNGVHFEPLPAEVKEYFAQTYPEFDGETTALDYYSLEDHESPYHDHKSRNDVKQEETEKFFRYVNKVMNDTLVRDQNVDVILVTLPEHDHEFRSICTFKQLLPESILKDARTMTGKELRDAAIDILQKKRDKGIANLTDEYAAHAAKGTATDSLPDIGLALVERKVGALFLEKGKGIPGTFNTKTGEVDYDPSTDPTDDKKLDPASPDIANAFALAALEQDARVLVLDADKMPTKTGIAALYRY